MQSNFEALGRHHILALQRGQSSTPYHSKEAALLIWNQTWFRPGGAYNAVMVCRLTAVLRCIRLCMNGRHAHLPNRSNRHQRKFYILRLWPYLLSLIIILVILLFHSIFVDVQIFIIILIFTVLLGPPSNSKTPPLQVKNTSLQVKNIFLQEKYTSFQVKNTSLQLKNTSLEVRNTFVQVKNTSL